MLAVGEADRAGAAGGASSDRPRRPLVTALTAARSVLQPGAVEHGELFVHRASRISLSYADRRTLGLVPHRPVDARHSDRDLQHRLLRATAISSGGRPSSASTFNVLIGAVELVFVAGDAITFLFAWELMTLTAAALVTTEHEERDSRRAAYLYLVMSHVGHRLSDRRVPRAGVGVRLAVVLDAPVGRRGARTAP